MEKYEVVHYEELLNLTTRHLATGPFPKSGKRFPLVRWNFWRGYFWLMREAQIVGKIDNIAMKKVSERHVSKRSAFRELRQDLRLIGSTWGSGYKKAVTFLTDKAGDWEEFDRTS